MKFVTKTVHKLCSSCISNVENLMKSRTVRSRSGVIWSGAVRGTLSEAPGHTAI